MILFCLTRARYSLLSSLRAPLTRVGGMRISSLLIGLILCLRMVRLRFRSKLRKATIFSETLLSGFIDL